MMPEQEHQPMVCSQSKRPVNHGMGNGEKGLVRSQSSKRRLSCVSSTIETPDQSSEFYMLEGISAAENDYLQRRANALMRRMFRRRVNDPAKTVADLRSRLRRAGWVQIKIEWCCDFTLLVRAGIGVKLKAKLCKLKFSKLKFPGTERWLFADFVRAARKVGLKPGIEDLSVDLKGQRIEASVSAVPVADMSAVFDRMLDGWRDQSRAKAARPRKATTCAAGLRQRRGSGASSSWTMRRSCG
jgi:hypothetical protein